MKIAIQTTNRVFFAEHHIAASESQHSFITVLPWHLNLHKFTLQTVFELQGSSRELFPMAHKAVKHAIHQVTWQPQPGQGYKLWV
jgi:hypothetical protein